MSEDIKQTSSEVVDEVVEEEEVKKPKVRRKTQRNSSSKNQEPKYKFFDLVRPIKKA